MQYEFVAVLCACYLFSGGHQKVRSKFLLQHLQSWLSLRTREKIDYKIFVLMSS